MEDESEQHQNEILKPKPLFIDSDNINDLLQIVDTVASGHYTYKLQGKTQIRFMPASTKIYTLVAKLLEQKKISFHTYQLSSNRCFRVVLRGMHHTACLDDIKFELDERGHNVLRIHNIKHRLTKEPLNMFFIDIEKKSNNKEILDIKFLLHASVEIEMPYAKKEIIQCQRCQRYGHSKTYCRHPFRCVKCAMDHPTNLCPKSENRTPAKCVLCAGAHPANYRGCAVYKEIQLRKYPVNRPKVPLNTHILQTQPSQPSQQPPVVKQPAKVSTRDPRLFNKPTLSYAQAVCDSNSSQNNSNFVSPSNNQFDFQRFSHTSRVYERDYNNIPNNNNNDNNNQFISRIEQLLLKQAEHQIRLAEDIRTMLNLLTALVTKLT